VKVKFEPNRYKHEQLAKAYEIVISTTTEKSIITQEKQVEALPC
jgi:hypothetical protein